MAQGSEAAAQKPGVTVDVKRILLAHAMKPLPGNQPLDMGYVGKKAKAYLSLPFGGFPTGCQKVWSQESANAEKSI